MELVLLGVHRDAGERVIEAGGAGRVGAVALELQIQGRIERRAAGIGHGVAHVHVVAAAMQRVCLGDLQAAGFRLEHHIQRVAGQRALAGH